MNDEDKCPEHTIEVTVIPNKGIANRHIQWQNIKDIPYRKFRDTCEGLF